MTLTLAIGPDGRVEHASVSGSSGHAELDEAAAAWVTAHWRYTPATRDGQPVPATVQARVRFDLRNP